MVGAEKSSLRPKQRSLTLKGKNEIRDIFLCSKVLPKFTDGSTGFIRTGLSNDALIKIKIIYSIVKNFNCFSFIYFNFRVLFCVRVAEKKLMPVVIGQSKKQGGLMLSKQSLWKDLLKNSTESDLERFFVDNTFSRVCSSERIWG